MADEMCRRLHKMFFFLSSKSNSLGLSRLCAEKSRFYSCRASAIFVYVCLSRVLKKFSELLECLFPVESAYAAVLVHDLSLVSSEGPLPWLCF